MAEARLRIRTLDGQPLWQLRCPGCSRWGYIDEDQFFGRVSVECGYDCGYHETVNWSPQATAEDAERYEVGTHRRGTGRESDG